MTEIYYYFDDEDDRIYRIAGNKYKGYITFTVHVVQKGVSLLEKYHEVAKNGDIDKVLNDFFCLPWYADSNAMVSEEISKFFNN